MRGVRIEVAHQRVAKAEHLPLGRRILLPLRAFATPGLPVLAKLAMEVDIVGRAVVA
jgi:hypothetical protein